MDGGGFINELFPYSYKLISPGGFFADRMLVFALGAVFLHKLVSLTLATGRKILRQTLVFYLQLRYLQEGLC